MSIQSQWLYIHITVVMVAQQLRCPRSDSELRLQSLWSFACSLGMHTGFLQVFPVSFNLLLSVKLGKASTSWGLPTAEQRIWKRFLASALDIMRSFTKAEACTRYSLLTDLMTVWLHDEDLLTTDFQTQILFEVSVISSRLLILVHSGRF